MHFVIKGVFTSYERKEREGIKRKEKRREERDLESFN